MLPLQDPWIVSRLVKLFRVLADVSQEELARRAGLNPDTIRLHENGSNIPRPDTWLRLTRAVRLTMPFVEAVLVPVLAACRKAQEAFPFETWEDVERVAAALEPAIAAAAREPAVALRQALSVPEPPPWAWRGAPRPEDRTWGQAAARRLQARPAARRRELLETWPEFQTWGVAAELGELSAAAAADDAGEALALAELAVRAAELAPCDQPWRARTLSYCLAFLANAQRVTGQLRLAADTFARAATLWKEGSAADPDLLPEWRRLDLEASLRIEERRYAEALDFLARARAGAPQGAEGRILLKEASALQGLEEGAQVVALLRRAAPILEVQGDARLLFGARFNLADTLCDLERYDEAEALLPQVWAATEALGNKLDRVRSRWLEGKVGAGLGRTGEAMQALEEVRQAFARDEIAFDTALVSLDLAELLLPQGRTAEVRELAEAMWWIFEAEAMEEHALAALAVFCEAAKKEAATVELAQRVHRFLERARHDPEARF
ncbi:MAG TPA: helix-turn-helix transcriptional regulator [Thermoanaerobaculia bacterium]